MSLKGTWIFNDMLVPYSPMPSGIDAISIAMNNLSLPCIYCTVGNESSNLYAMLQFANANPALNLLRFVMEPDGWFDVKTFPMYSQSTGWTNNAYKTITFIDEPNDFGPNEEIALAWLNMNATKQPDLPKYLVKGNDLQNIANVIREKTRGSSPLSFPDDFVNGILNIGANSSE